MIKKQDKNTARQKRQIRVRSKLSGTGQQPRLNVYRSLTHIYAQIIDDSTSKTLCSASTLEKGIQSKLSGKNKTDQAFIIGESVAKKALKLGIKQVVFDRAGYIYTGRVKKVAEGARNAGLVF